MDRRNFSVAIARAAAALATLPALGASEVAHAAAPSLADLAQGQDHQDPMSRLIDDLAQGDAATREMILPKKWRRIGMFAYPGMYPLDFLNPKVVFGDMLNTRVHIIGKTLAPIGAGMGVQVTPDVTLETCPDNLDVLFVPGGGPGTIAMMRDAAVLAFLRKQAETARYITSVCTGSLVLGAAGLLKGYKATSHWVTHEVLREFGATPVKARVVEDRNRITGGGVTAGLDFALLLTARLASENYAKAEQLNIEYAPAPPFNAGSPEGAGPVVHGAMARMYGSLADAARKAAKEANG
jgi:cyclohexyl-isocyanide hydratase